MDFQGHTYFKVIFSDGVLCMWHKPQTFTHVFKTFKSYCGNAELGGLLLCGDRIIRFTGSSELIQSIIKEYAFEA